MRTVILTVLILIFNSCINLFPKEERLLKSYKVNDTITVDLVYIGLGATTKDVIEVQKRTAKDKSVITRIEGFNDTYHIDINSFSDSLIKVTFTDTVVFKTKGVEVLVNLNDRLKDTITPAK